MTSTNMHRVLLKNLPSIETTVKTAAWVGRDFWNMHVDSLTQISFKKIFYFKLTFELQKSCSYSKESSCILFNQFPRYKHLT